MAPAPVVVIVTVLGVGILVCLFGWGLWLGQRRHEAMTLIALGEVLRLEGDHGAARTYYTAAGDRGVDLVEVPVLVQATRDRSTEPLVHHPLVDDVRRRMATDPAALDAWLADRSLPPASAPGPDGGQD